MTSEVLKFTNNENCLPKIIEFVSNRNENNERESQNNLMNAFQLTAL